MQNIGLRWTIRVLIQGESTVKSKMQALVGRGAAGVSAASEPPPASSLLKGVAWRTAFDKLFPALAVRTRLYLGEVHLHNLFKKKKTTQA